MRQQLDTAVRLSLAGQVRNRFAWILLVAFVPVWYLVIGSMISHAGVAFRLRATGATVTVDGHNLTLITAGLSSITLITGFVVFATVRRARPFDRRLVLSGYRPAALIAAKTCGALVQAVAIGAYAAVVMLFFWRPAGLWAIAVTFMLAAAAFALLGLAVLRLRMPRPARAAAPAGTPSTGTPSTGTPSTSPHHQTPMAAVAQTSGGPGRNPGESGLPADQR